MEGPGAAAVGGGNNVPAFLTKLWTLVEDPETDSLICWSPSGNSFHVFDQGQFAKEVLPKYFKHNNMASFVRQLNMYGFRKVVHIEQGGLVKPEKDDTEFQHPYFIRGQEHLLENIKRKVNSVSSIKNEDIKVRQDNVTKLLTDIQVMKGKQESMDSKLLAMKQYLRAGSIAQFHNKGWEISSSLEFGENEALWREVASLRQKHTQQQKVVNKLIQFLISLVQSNRILGVKRKIPLMLNDSSSAHSMPKYSRQYSLEHLHGSSPYTASSPAYSGSNLYSPDSSANSGPIISDVTELAQSSPSASPSGSLEERSSPVVRIKEEPPSPTRSPQENEPGTATAAAADSSTQPHTPQKCLSVACLDKNELSDHLDTMDSNLDNLQTMLTTHGFSVDTSALLDLFSPSMTVTDMNLPDLDSSLASIQDLLSSQEQQKPAETEPSPADTGKQLVHYTAQPLFLVDSSAVDVGSGDLPIFFELGEGPYFTEGEEYPEDPNVSLLAGTEQPEPKDPGGS
ncbi:heat shock factor protein 1 isoform X10 [Heliangelus exortis]|uniref:heat shock factor protein 1 isoform X10 n=1 Tax=Heliangelus exortis TaxID=472823 RepID=UPI003A934549